MIKKSFDFHAMKPLNIFRCVMALSAAGIASANAQMAIPGKFDVTPIGAARYTIPIQVPPGVAGMEPKLELSYNSRGGNGLLGMGWSLAGLHAISRCPRTSPQDGVKGAVAYDANDRFCLDGKRLVLISGTYGVAGSTYGTEIEIFAKVTAYGEMGSGPQYFIVKTKDGHTMEFGNTVDSRIAVAANVSSVKQWNLNKFSDSVGNTQSVVYGAPASVPATSTDFNSYPLRIDYTSNSLTGLAATNSVEFSYGTRTDVLSGYRGGFPYRVSAVITSITTKTNASAVSIYKPTYTAGIGGRTTMSSLSQCAAAGTPCMAITKFGLGSVTGAQFSFGSIIPVTTKESSVSGGQWISMDINGDGKTDLIHFTDLSGVYRVWISNGDGTFAIQEFATTADASISTGFWVVIDVNGDGRPDLVHITTTAGLMRIWKSNGDGTFAITDFSSTKSDVALSDGIWRVIDVNGDGRADLMHMTQNGAQAHVWISNGDSTFTISDFTNTVDHQIYDEGFFRNGWQIFDVNGDGLADIVHLYRLPNGTLPDGAQGGSWISVWMSNGDGTFRISKQRDFKLLASATVIQIDVNGDGFPDLVLMQSANIPTSQGSHAEVLISKGDGTFDIGIPVGGMWQQGVVNSLPDDPVQWGTWHVFDADGDGLLDLVHTPTGLSTGQFWVYHSNGDGTFAISQSNGGSVSADSCTSFCLKMPDGDFLGIGSPGFVHLDESSSTVSSAWYLSHPPANMVTSVSNGVGGKISWDLNALPALLKQGSYSKDIPSDSNTWTLASAIPVVSAVHNTATSWLNQGSMSDLNRSTFLSYGSARVERDGRGFLGFNWQQSKDSITGLTTRTYFRQDFPYTGQVATTGIGAGGASGDSWNNISLTTTSYSCTALDGGVSCPIASGKRYFVYPSQVETQAWDLDGTALPRSRAVNSNPDLYGNLQNTATYVLNPDGSPTDYSKVTTNTYYNDPTNWYLGRLLKSVTVSSGPDVAAPVAPGSGNLPAAAAPTSPQTTGALMAILQLLLGDD